MTDNDWLALWTHCRRVARRWRLDDADGWASWAVLGCWERWTLGHRYVIDQWKVYAVKLLLRQWRAQRGGAHQPASGLYDAARRQDVMAWVAAHAPETPDEVLEGEEMLRERLRR